MARLYDYTTTSKKSSKIYGVSKGEPKVGYFESCYGKLTPELYLSPTKWYGEGYSGCTQIGDGWYIKDFEFYVGEASFGMLTPGDKSVVRFHNKLLIFPDKKCLNLQTSVLSDFVAPDISVATVFGNRVFGIGGNTLYACALGDETDWTSFTNADGSPKESGAYRVSIDAPFTAILSFMSHVVVFTADKMYELYGSRPGNFTLTPALEMGVLAQRLVSANLQNLYFLSHQKLWLYKGGGASDLLNGLQIVPSAGNLCAYDEGLYLGGPDGIAHFDGLYTQLYGDPCTGLFLADGKVYGKIDMDMLQLMVGDVQFLKATTYPPIANVTGIKVTLLCKGDMSLYVGTKLVAHSNYATVGAMSGFCRCQTPMPQITISGQGDCLLMGIKFEGKGGGTGAVFT